MTLLCELADKYGTDKHTPLRYTEGYYDALEGRPVLTLLEIGICTKRNIPNSRTGASLFMWAEFFPGADIYGIDIDPAAMVNAGRIKSFCGDQSDPVFMASVAAAVGPFDVIVDDGSHNPEHQMVSAKALLPYLTPTGSYFIEDIRHFAFPGSTPEKLQAQLPKEYASRVFKGPVCDMMEIRWKCSI
jgi:hypothetical protein